MSEQDISDVIDAGVIADLRALGGDSDPSLLADLVGEYLTDAPERIDDLVRSLADGDGVGLGRAAHTLKSSSAYMGALGLAEMCRQIEEAARRNERADMQHRVERTQSEFERVRSALSRLIG